MSRGTLAALVAVVAVVVVAVFLGRAPQEPSGVAASSDATTPDGLAAYATLLQRAGHDVRRVRTPLDQRTPPASETLVIVDGRRLNYSQQDGLRRFVARGGHAILVGTAAHELGGDRRPGTLHVERGTVTLVDDPTPLRNRALAEGDNAAYALRLAGAPSRRIAFLETVHGYGDQTGLAALPARVKTTLWLLGLAALAFLLWRGRRLGPPELPARKLPPPRRAHVEALAAALARTKPQTNNEDST
jgi:uncharacterized iron-regulated membrane protein